VDTHRATNGIAPNFIHSLDATHLVMTTCKLPKDLNLCVIHDSFATHATDIETLRGILKGTFVELYDGRNYLQELRDSLPELPEGHEGYPPVPALGDLDVREVLKSEYLFS
jgi:DNA-directed RNA polymerase